MNVILNEEYIKANQFFGEKMKEMRKEVKPYITQEKLSNDIGISRSTLANYELARTAPPWWVACLLSRYFNKKISDFEYKREEEKNENITHKYSETG